MVEVVYEGKLRRFVVLSVIGASSTQNDDLDNLAAQLDGLALGSKPRLWTVGWDTFVTVVDEGSKATNVGKVYPHYL